MQTMGIRARINGDTDGPGRAMKGLSAMRRCFVLIALLTVGCAYHNPDQPTITPSTAPSAIRLLASPRGDQRVDISATVITSEGQGVPGVSVAFSATAGTFVGATTAITDGTGAARTILANAGTAIVRASAGDVSASVGVISSAPTPIPPATVTAILNSPTSGTVGSAVTFSVSATAVAPIWNWTFGDGATAQTSAFSTTHIYGRQGVYPVSVSATGINAGSATVTIQNAPEPPAPQTPQLSATMNCTPGTRPASPAPATATTCNVAATYGGSPVASNAIGTSWDWGDGQTTVATPTPLGTNTYAQAGTYLIISTVTYTPAGGTLQTTTASKSQAVP